MLHSFCEKLSHVIFYFFMLFYGEKCRKRNFKLYTKLKIKENSVKIVSVKFMRKRDRGSLPNNFHGIYKT